MSQTGWVRTRTLFQRPVPFYACAQQGLEDELAAGSHGDPFVEEPRETAKPAAAEPRSAEPPPTAREQGVPTVTPSAKPVSTAPKPKPKPKPPKVDKNTLSACSDGGRGDGGAGKGASSPSKTYEDVLVSKGARPSPPPPLEPPTARDFRPQKTPRGSGGFFEWVGSRIAGKDADTSMEDVSEHRGDDLHPDQRGQPRRRRSKAGFG